MSRPPIATYRLQLTPRFTLRDAAGQVPYLRALGISHLYLSPILEARAGSGHGYDVTDHGRVRAELGGEEGFEALVAAAHAAGLGIVLDIVPNHMAASAENPWWRDLLEFGVDSPYARVYDLGWRSDADQGRLLLPILGDERRAIVERGEITLDLDGHGLLLCYGGRFFPVTPAAYGPALRALGAERAARTFDELEPPPPAWGPALPQRRSRALAVRDGWLCGLGAFAEEVRAAIEAWNARPSPERARVVEELAEGQPYELAFWRRGSREISYRRFFDVTDLAGVRVEDDAVFRLTHGRILALVARGDVQGLRIDHVDGLRDPAQYLGRLAQAHDARPWLLVEKIVAPDEALPADWPVAGTTGYEFATTVGGWFIDPDGWREMRRAYGRFTGSTQPFEDLAYERQRAIIDALFGGELRVLVRALSSLAGMHAPGDHDEAGLASALAEVSACLSVYRTYIMGWPVSVEDRGRIERAVADASRRAPGLPPATLAWLRSVLLLEVPAPARAAALDFVLQWQQFTGPVMAKGFEDTALYNDFTLAAANEVGGHPGDPCVDAAALHDFLARRAHEAQAALSTTSTHDTKRSEDTRLRIAALTRDAGAWTAFLDRRAHDLADPDPAVPSPADRVLLYQTLIATWPDDPDDAAYAERITAYMVKAAKEAKARTSWRDPDDAYEAALGEAVRAALRPGTHVRRDLAGLARAVRRPAALASLAQTVLKVTAPGVPDFYQGSELWHVALVDPDNRREVDYAGAARAWESIRGLIDAPRADDVRALAAARDDGRIKLFVTAAALHHRAAWPALYARGDYVPLAVDGGDANGTFAFLRQSGGASAVTIVRRGELVPAGAAGATATVLHAAGWRDIFTGRTHVVRDGRLAVGGVLDILPCAVLVPERRAR